MLTKPQWWRTRRVLFAAFGFEIPEFSVHYDSVQYLKISRGIPDRAWDTKYASASTASGPPRDAGAAGMVKHIAALAQLAL
jgi:hypothetical protein